MITTTRLLCAQKWKDSVMPKTEEWLVKVTDLVEMAKMICLIRERPTFISD